MIFNTSMSNFIKVLDNKEKAKKPCDYELDLIKFYCEKVKFDICNLMQVDMAMLKNKKEITVPAPSGKGSIKLFKEKEPGEDEELEEEEEITREPSIANEEYSWYGH